MLFIEPLLSSEVQMSGYEEMKCCRLIFALLEQQTDFAITEGPGFLFKDDGLYISAKDEDAKLLRVKLLSRRSKEEFRFDLVLSGAAFDSINSLMIDVLNSGKSRNRIEKKLYYELSNFFALNYHKF